MMPSTPNYALSLTFLHYSGQVVRRATELGVGSLLAKIDIKSAYRLVPVHPGDSHYLKRVGWPYYGWHAAIWFMVSTKKFFMTITYALEWCVHQACVEDIFHYLEDYVSLGLLIPSFASGSLMGMCISGGSFGSRET